MSKIDMHLHSSYSDGSDSVLELYQNIRLAGIKIFALTDHDTINGCKEMASLVASDIKFIPSIELTCQTEDVKCHILGYNCNPDNESINALIQKGKTLRKIKLDTRVQYLKDTWGIELNKEELDWLYSRRSVVKTHIANVLVNRGLAQDNLSAMRKYLDGCKSGDTRFDVKEAIQSIKSAGGTVVWAHPIGGEGEEHLQPEEFKRRFEILKKCGIEGLECYYSRYDKAEIKFLLDFAKENSMLISGGSDYHGSNKNIPLAKLNIDNEYIDSSLISSHLYE